MPEKTITGRMILLPDNAGIAVVDTASIIRIQAISNYSKLFFTNGKKLVVAKVLKRFEQELASNGFIRPHRTHLVNKKFIVRYIDDEAGKIELSTGELIDVSKRRKPGFLNAWRIYTGSLSPL